jgi:hypothetical protein
LIGPHGGPVVVFGNAYQCVRAYGHQQDEQGDKRQILTGRQTNGPRAGKKQQRRHCALVRSPAKVGAGSQQRQASRCNRKELEIDGEGVNGISPQKNGLGFPRKHPGANAASARQSQQGQPGVDIFAPNRKQRGQDQQQ